MKVEEISEDLLKFKIYQNQLLDQTQYLTSKLNNIESNLPDLIRAIVDVLLSQKDRSNKELFVTKTDLKTAVSFKLDADVFQSYQKQQIVIKQQDTSRLEIDS